MQTMTPQEFEDHWSDYREAPWGGERDDVLAANICATIASYAGKMVKPGAQVRLSDFMPFGRREQTELTPEDLMKQLTNG